MSKSMEKAITLICMVIISIVTAVILNLIKMWFGREAVLAVSGVLLVVVIVLWWNLEYD